MQIVLIVLAAVITYAWVFYPFLLAVLSRQVSRREKCNVAGGSPLPVAILVSAHNEENVIRARLENLVLGWSRESGVGIAGSEVQILVGIDGSTDRTAAIAHEFAAKHDNVHVLEFSQRRGKIAVLKDLVRKSGEELVVHSKLYSVNSRRDSESRIKDSESSSQPFQLSGLRSHPSSILVFTDANTVFKPDALERLLFHFADPRIGGVCGRLVFKDITDHRLQITVSGSPVHSSPSEAFYWRWETQIKVMESRVDSCLGANGAIYAVRSELFWRDVPDNTIVDDFVIGMKVRERGFRMVFEPEAVAEEVFPGEKNEWRRRVRIGAGDYQALARCWKCLLPRYREFACMFFSHKVLRWFTPHIVLLMAAVSVVSVVRHGVSAGAWLPLAVLICLAGLLFCSGAGRIMSSSVHPASRFFRLCNYFVVMNAALFAGSIRFLSGNLKGYWERTPRS